MIRTEPEAFYASGMLTVGPAEIDALKSEVSHTQRKRIRVCMHKDIFECLHEMFIVYTDKTIVQPHKHAGKDESLCIMEGYGQFMFFNDSGEVTETIEMGAYGSGKPFYVRVPQNTFHTLVMHSETLVLHCSTSGPFDRKDTVWATW